MTNERILGIVCSHMSDAPSTRKRPKNLTKRQTAFRDAILAGFNPSDAYRKSFNAKGMSKKSISVEAAKLLRHKNIALAITLAVQEARGQTVQVLPSPSPAVQLSLQRRMEELAHMALLDPAELFDDMNHFKSIRDIPEHVRRCIQSFEVDPVSFVLKVKVHDKQTAIMNYSKLVGDIPPQQVKVLPPADNGRSLLNWQDVPAEQRKTLREKIATVIREHLYPPKVVNG